MKFKFAFETLMKERAARRDEAEREFRLAESKVREQMRVLADMRSLLNQAKNEVLKVRTRGGKLSGSLASYEEFVEGQKIRIRNQTKTVKSLEEVTERKRSVLVERNRDLKILEKLKEKRYNEFLRERRKQEAKVLDEIAILRSARRVS